MAALKPSKAEINVSMIAAVALIKHPFLMKVWVVLKIDNPQILTKQCLLETSLKTLTFLL